MNEIQMPRDVSSLLGWIEAATPGTLIPAGELAERIRALPIVSRPQAEPRAAPEQLLTAEQVAEWLQLNTQSVYRLAREGKIKRVQVSDNTVRFSRSEVERFLDRRAG